MNDPLRVLIVDDSRIFRSVIEEALAEIDGVKAVGSVWSGDKAIDFVRQSPPDLITLDIQMPGIGGLETLRAIRKISEASGRPVGVLLISSHTRRGAEVTIEGLHEGAIDFITKPDGPDERANFIRLRDELQKKILVFRNGRRSISKTPALIQGTARTRSTLPENVRFRAVVIGASTGGPEAILKVLPLIVQQSPVPIFLVQHLPTDFTEYFCASLQRRCGGRIIVAKEGMSAEPQTVYVAPGGSHLVLHRYAEKLLLGLSDAPPENSCRPSVDVLFRSAAATLGQSALAVVLTGMGSDGARGAVALRRAGSQVIVQDEATSVVWGMPGSTAAAGGATEILPIHEIGPFLRRQLQIGE